LPLCKPFYALPSTPFDNPFHKNTQVDTHISTV
jgi:hypothetical protein